MKQSLTILITGAGSPGAPGVIKSLRSADGHSFRLIGMDIHSSVAAKSMLDHFTVGPKATDASFVEKCLELCSLEKVDVILPLVTAELPIFSSNLARFEEIGTTIPISDSHSLEQVIHKETLFETLQQKGFSVPRFTHVQTVDELSQAFDDFGYPNHPVCFKPTVSDGSRGFRVFDANMDKTHHLFYEKPTSTYMSRIELFSILENSVQIPDLLVMEYLPKQEYSVDLLVDHGKVLVAIPRLREETQGGISTKGKIVKETDVIEYATQIVEQLGLHGNIGVQVKRNKKGQPRILEINPRIQGTIVHCTAAGVNLPYLAIKLAKGLPIKADEISIHWGIEMVRYWEENYFDENGNAILWGKE